MMEDFPLLLHPDEPGSQYAVVSRGPDHRDNEGQWFMFGGEAMEHLGLVTNPGFEAGEMATLYDPTNGASSEGDIVRVAP